MSKREVGRNDFQEQDLMSKREVGLLPKSWMMSMERGVEMISQSRNLMSRRGVGRNDFQEQDLMSKIEVSRNYFQEQD